MSTPDYCKVCRSTPAPPYVLGKMNGAAAAFAPPPQRNQGKGFLVNFQTLSTA